MNCQIRTSADPSYVYNGIGTRVSRMVNAATTNWKRAGAGVTAAVLNENAVRFTPGISFRDGSTSTFSHAGLKNTERQSTTTSITATRQHDAFGNVISSSGTWQTAFGYAGNFGYQQTEDNLQLLGHRYYDSETGRFISRDPIKDGRNWYGYGGGALNPVTGTDPSGYAIIRIGRRGVAGGTHLFIIIICEVTGEVFTVSGGPERTNGFGIVDAGNLEDNSGQFSDSRGRPIGGNYERRNGVTSTDGLEILNDDRLGRDWFNELSGYGQRIEDGNNGYSLLTTNSNAFIWNVLVLAGLVDEFAWRFAGGSPSKFGIDKVGQNNWWPGWQVPLKLGGSSARR